MSSVAVITVTMLFLQTLAAPQNKLAKVGTSSNLSHEELYFITQVRRGVPAKPPKSLSPCAKAILGCCNGKQIDADCSEALQCGGHFFDDNPCDDKFVIDALKAANAFYNQFKKAST